jgi:hypothetical protein
VCVHKELVYIRGEQWELTAISEASAERKEQEEDFPRVWQLFDEMDILPELENEEFYNFYNVLWVEAEGVTSYRKALGRVTKDAWEKQDLNVTKVVLG